MDKTAIKTFAINSRKKLMEDVEYKMSLVGINKDRISEPISSADGIETYQIGGTTNSIYDEDILKREQLVREVKQKGFENVVEEVAYTWFNRIIAIRFMEINNFLPTKTRVLSSETPGKIEPDIITEAFDIDLDYTQEDKELIFKLKDENKLDELFRFLFIKQSNKLNEILPGLFEKTDDYLELLLNISFTNEDGVVRQLIDTIPEEDFGSQVEIIGWLYQFYNTELKDETFANLKKRIKISKERIPAATQLFTPDWIVKYMVENSVGRLWLEGHPNEDLKSKWKYYVEEAEQEAEVEQQLIALRKESEILKPEDITVIDPCMGSGHILVYVFEVLMDIYVSEGYTEKDACESILKNNLYGLDIDKRAYQFAYFAVLMKARKYNRGILTKDISPLLCSIEETNSISEDFIDELISQDKTIESDLRYLISSFKDAKEYGSILDVNPIDYDKIKELILIFELDNNLIKFRYQNEMSLLKNIINQAIILSKKYDVVITNPPYMGISSMNPKLSNYVKSNYPLSKADLFSVFIEKGYNMIKDNRFNCMVTMQSWMFLSHFEKFRKDLLSKSIIINLLHMDNGVMGIAFGTASFVVRKWSNLKFNGVYNNILFKDISENNIPISFPVKENRNNVISLEKFNKIPGSPIAYWVSDNVRNNFEGTKSISDICVLKQGLATGENKKFIRLWHEIDFRYLGLGFHSSESTKNSNFKWYPYNKGGKFRKWYGNNEYVVDWQDCGKNIKQSKLDKLNKGLIEKKNSECWNEKYYFKKGITYSLFGFKNFGVRYKDWGFVFDVSGSSIFVEERYLKYVLAFLASNISFLYLSTLAPTVNFQVGNISSLPLIIDENFINQIDRLSNENILISKEDWDNYEESWDFKTHPYLKFYTDDELLSEIFNVYQEHIFKNYNKLKHNEELLNEIFIKIYNLEDDLTSEVNERDIALRFADFERDSKSFISYAIGCMFGRYSLDDDGIQFAGGEFNLNKYHKFIPDDDNIIPVLDSEYFEDDIVGRFVEFVKVCFGEENLEENLDFIADALAKNKKPSRERIRDYLLKNFFNDHKKTYKKCPIYWQFNSGKQNGFNCLVYMHRYEPSLVARIRTDYLHKTQKAIEQAIANCDNIINHSSSNTEITKATKDKNKLQKQLKETQEYDEALAHIANQNIEIDLDDGVKVNYAKFQNVEVSKEGKKSKKINLLKKL